jgi:hypothetical protein
MPHAREAVSPLVAATLAVGPTLAVGAAAVLAMDVAALRAPAVLAFLAAVAATGAAHRAGSAAARGSSEPSRGDLQPSARRPAIRAAPSEPCRGGANR